ncbi:MAG: hypothetical protein ACI9FJ_002053, partial [Alteromonadaceae bacterium]
FTSTSERRDGLYFDFAGAINRENIFDFGFIYFIP